jgi:ribosome-associated translation inhibitor RaiA
MSDHPPIIADSLRVHGNLATHEVIDLVDHWAKLDQRLQSFRDRTIDLDLHVNDRDTPSQHITLDVQIGGLKTLVAKSSSSSLRQGLNEVRDEMIRQLTDAKTRTEPRNNRKLRESMRRMPSD